MWNLDSAELLSCSGDDGSVVLGVLGESVVSLSGSGLVRVSHPVRGTQSAETHLEQTRLTVVNFVTLRKHMKVLVVSKEGFLYQVCLWTVRHPVTRHRRTDEDESNSSPRRFILFSECYEPAGGSSPSPLLPVCRFPGWADRQLSSFLCVRLCCQSARKKNS